MTSFRHQPQKRKIIKAQYYSENYTKNRTYTKPATTVPGQGENPWKARIAGLLNFERPAEEPLVGTTG